MDSVGADEECGQWSEPVVPSTEQVLAGVSGRADEGRHVLTGDPEMNFQCQEHREGVLERTTCDATLFDLSVHINDEIDNLRES